jgi:hypothetical protein
MPGHPANRFRIKSPELLVAEAGTDLEGHGF